MSKVLTCFIISDEFIDNVDPNRYQFTHTPVEFTDTTQVAAELLLAIRNNDEVALEELLKKPFIYPGDGKWVPVDEDYTYHLKDRYHFTYQGNLHIRNLTYEYYYTRPLLEALFLEHPEIFQRLIAAVASSPCAPLHASLVSHLQQNPAFPKDLCQAVDIPRLESRIKALNDYGNELNEKQRLTRSIQTLALAQELQTFASEHVPHPKLSNPQTVAIQWLDFKLRFIQTLHDYDHHFVGHHGHKCLLVNIATVIFSAAILNILNYAVTGNFLFFKKTTTASLIDAIDQNIQVSACWPISQPS